MSKNTVVITSIFEPTEAVKQWASHNDWHVVVAGDAKGPFEWELDNSTFLSLEVQEATGFSLAEVLPKNHYCRKLIAYLHAVKSGSEFILDTDDDNYPKEPWEVPSFKQMIDVTEENMGFVNVYANYTSQKIWPRGFPLNLILDEAHNQRSLKTNKEERKVAIWQGLVDGDPDVDAIYRLTINKLCTFDKKDAIVLSKGTFCPFNSQNTLFNKIAFPLLYLPSTVSFRFTDILRGLVAQPILEAAGLSLAFVPTSVYQDRNPHDYMKDFQSEVACYLESERATHLVKEAVSESKGIAENLEIAYKALHGAGIVEELELELLSRWIQDLKSVE